MRNKTLLMVGALSLMSLGIASAKTYDIRLTEPAMAGTTQLQPGEYKLKVEGSEAVFTDVETAKSFKAAVKVQNANRKFNETAVETIHQGDMDHINTIDLGGSNTQLQFNQ